MKQQSTTDWTDVGVGIGIVMLIPIGLVAFIHFLHTPNPEYDRCIEIAKVATTTDAMPVICHQWFR